MPILISDEIVFKVKKSSSRDGMGQCIMIYGSVFLDNVAVLGIYKSNGRVSRCMQKLIKL